MIAEAVFIGLALALFALSFISKRRFGLLGLGLTAGATLSLIWGDTASLLVSMTGLVSVGSTTNAVALSLVILAPAIVLLFHGYAYKDLFSRLVGSFLFTILALAFLLEPVSHALPLVGTSAYLFNQALHYKNVVISIGVVLAVVDLLFAKPVRSSEKEHKKK